MAESSKVFILLLVIVSLITTPGRCQQSQTDTSSGTSPVVATLSIIGGIVGFVAIIVPVFVYMCYRVSKAKEKRRRDFYAAAPSSQTQAVYSSYGSQTTTTTAATAQQQAPPTVVYNASYSLYDDSTGTSGGQLYPQSRVLYSIEDQPHDSRASAPQNTRYVTDLPDIVRQRIFARYYFCPVVYFFLLQ